ncbi:hypothetical protein WHR41_06475 [Cladosporium halotolerans]|uniref:Metallo-dependent hydrolase n=1 Tax=Cladosporium halotolerans TaxID=1052096 RepID=A0AB34KN82_9PEZI
MAQAFLATHGIDLDAELHRLQADPNNSNENPQTSPEIRSITNAILPGTAHPSTLTLTSSTITSINPSNPSQQEKSPPPSQPLPQSTLTSPHPTLLAPSLCHPHIHLDKPYLLSHPRFAAAQILREGTFAEAMALTSAAKRSFTRADLLQRGQRLLDESAAAGVTHARAFVEVDGVVGTKCLEAGLELKAGMEGRLRVQVCAFAQEALFSGSEGDEDGGKGVVRALMEEAAVREEVEALGSTPYVEGDRGRMERNVEWMVELAVETGKHLDFHLDYNLDAGKEALVWFVVRTLRGKGWRERNAGKTVVLGHCTRLSLFTDDEWRRLRDEIGDLPVSFVGLPTSDLFMMRTPERTRGTLDVPRMIKEYGLNACIGVNNVGNAFTPQGSCDPLALACSCIGVYSAGLQADAEMLYECVSTRARKAIGFGRVDGEKPEDSRVDTAIHEGDKADLLLFGSDKEEWRTRASVSEAIYLHDQGRGRRAMLEGRLANE